MASVACRSAEMSPIDVRLEVLQLMGVDARVRRVGIEVGRLLHRRDAAPGRDDVRRHVLPRLAVVLRDLDETVVGADPEERCAER